MAIPPDGRFDLDTVNVVDFPLPVFVEYDYTHPDVAATYAAHIQVIFEIFSRQRTVPPPAVDEEDFITQADADNVQVALAELELLAQNGLVRNNTDTTTKTFFLTKEMATNLDLLIRSFKAVGSPDPTAALTDIQLEKWKDLSVTSPVIQNILQVAIAAIPTNRSLQSLIELEYVRTGNELIEEKFSDLEDALSITQQLLDSLARLQDIRNRQVIEQRSALIPGLTKLIPPGISLGGTPAVFTSAYRASAARYFDPPIVPILPSTIVIYNATRSITGLTTAGFSVFANLIAIKQSLMLFVPRLSALGPPEALLDPNSLYNRVKKLVTDFNTAFGVYNGTVFTSASLTGMGSLTQGLALAQFLLDNQNTRYSNVTGRTPGDSQSNLTFAITSGQGLNDQQKEEVRRFLFVFEEFYKSAAAMLQRITQILEKMAQNISR